MNLNADDCVDHFNQKASQWHLLYDQPMFRDRLNLFVTHIKEVLPAPSEILDFGCGAGVISLNLSQAGYRVTGVDAAKEMIDAAEKTRVQKKNNNVSFKTIDFSTLSLEKDSFDGVICSSVIEYLEDGQKLIKSLIEALRPNGFLLVSFPHNASFTARLEAYAPHMVSSYRRATQSDLCHSKRRYDKRKFLSFLQENSMGSFKKTYFEFPLLGNFSIPISRFGLLGQMLLIRAQKLP